MMYDSDTWESEDGVVFDIKRNVRSIRTDISNSAKDYVYYNEQIYDEPHIFFVFETPIHMSFGHWVFESAIYLPYFDKFKNASILVNKNPIRDYKKLFFDLFGIHDNKICYLDNNDEQLFLYDYENIPKNNICIVCRNFTWNDLSENSRNPSCLKLYTQLVMNFKHILTNNKTVDKTIEHLFLPRNSTQNLKYNDRIIDYTQIKKLLTNTEFVTYNTLETTDFHTQIELVSSAKNIYLDWGSNLLVNGFFSNESKIYCVNQMPHQRTYPFMRIIIHMIEQGNNVIYI